MGNYPLTAKEQHKRKEKLAKIRQTVMIVLMVVAGLYYMTVERSQVTNAAVVTNVKDAPEKIEDVNQIAPKKEKKFTIERFLESTSATDKVNGTEAEKETSIQKQTETMTVETIIIDPHSVPQDSVDAAMEINSGTMAQSDVDVARTTQAVPDTAANVAGVSGTEIQVSSVADTNTLQTEDKRVSLNTATLEELDALPGVGPSTAKNIIAYREAHGGFAAPEEIMNVKRIGEKTFDKLKEFIKV